MKNLIAATYAPMDESGNLSLDIIGQYGHFLQSNGVAGAFMNGSTGDFVSLSTAERKQIAEAWARQRPDDFTLINHVGHNSLREARELARHSVGRVDAISVLSPYYFRPPTLERLIDYCAEVADAAPELPFYYYHIPVLTGVDFPMIEFLEQAAECVPTLAGIKFTQADLEQYGRCVDFAGDRYAIWFGVDEQFVDSLGKGATGWVGSTYNHLAPIYHRIAEHYRAGEETEARELQAKAVAFVETLHAQCGFNGAGKSFMRELGLDFGACRYPHRALTQVQRTTVMSELDRLGLSAYFSQGAESELDRAKR